MRAPSKRITVGLAIAGPLAIVAVAVVLRRYIPTHNWLGTGHYALGFGDLHSRFADIWRIHHGYNLYSRHDHHQYFTYPPAALLLFWPLSWFKFSVDVVWWTAVSVLALAAMVGIAIRRVRPATSWDVVVAISCAVSLVSVALLPVVSIGIALGQIGTLIGLAVTADFLARSGRFRGVATGVAAAIKIYPIVIVVGWAVRREWRLVINALGGGAVTSLVALALFPTATRTFLSRQLFSGHELTHFLHNTHWLATSSSPYTVFFRWPFHGGSFASLAGWAASIACVALGLWASTVLFRRGLVVNALVMALGASALAGPVTWDHYYDFAPLLVVAAYEARELPWLRWGSLVALVSFAVPWQLGRNESFSVKGTNLRQLEVLVARNALSVTMVALMALSLVAAHRTRQRLDEPAAPGA